MSVNEMATVISQIDENGHVIIPNELRMQTNIAGRDKIEMCLEDYSIVIKKYVGNRCVLCDSPSEGNTFKGKYICSECLADFKK